MMTMMTIKTNGNHHCNNFHVMAWTPRATSILLPSLRVRRLVHGSHDTLLDSGSSRSSRSSHSASSLVSRSMAKGVFSGSGSDSMFDPRLSQAILELVVDDDDDDKKRAPDVPIQVVYLGTATYDLEQFRYRQTHRLIEQGCHVTHLKLTDNVPANRFQVIDDADVIIVGGGNTLFALDRWRKLGIIPALQRAFERDAVLCGGSAGAICWFDGGHSNGMDPDTYKAVRVAKFGGPNANPTMASDEIYATSSDEVKDWKYIRISALGFFPGLVSPHHDRVQSNGVRRADDFDQCLLRHSGERGIGIDHWASIIIDGDKFRILSLEEKGGSVLPNGDFCTDGSGVPGVWIKEVVNGKVERRLCPSQGNVSDLLRPATEIVEEIELMDQCRSENPDDGPLPEEGDLDESVVVG